MSALLLDFFFLPPSYVLCLFLHTIVRIFFPLLRTLRMYINGRDGLGGRDSRTWTRDSSYSYLFWLLALGSWRGVGKGKFTSSPTHGTATSPQKYLTLSFVK